MIMPKYTANLIPCVALEQTKQNVLALAKKPHRQKISNMAHN
jgi:hypothetical protein